MMIRFGLKNSVEPPQVIESLAAGMEGRVHRRHGHHDLLWLRHIDSPKTVNRCHPRCDTSYWKRPQKMDDGGLKILD